MNMKQLWPSLAGLVGVLLAAFAGPINEWVGSHPVEAIAIGQVITAIANVIKSPVQSPQA